VVELASQKHLAGQLGLLAFFPIELLKKCKKGKTAIIFIVCISGGRRIHFEYILIKAEGR
jgi:hypothetical protein